MIKYFITKVICLFIVLNYGFPAHAGWFQVEVIVFENLKPDLDGELWYGNPGLPTRDNSIDLITDIADLIDEYRDEEIEVNSQEVQPLDEQELVAYMALPEARYRLKSAYRVLKLSRTTYRPLIHVAWQQPGLDRNLARAVHLENPQEEDNFDEALPAELAEIQIEEDYPVLIFDGMITLRSSTRSGFLHVDVDVAYFPEENFQDARTQLQNTEENLYIYQLADYVRLTESRKIRLNELHYFDHPLFGVLVQVSRLKIDEDLISEVR